MSHIIVSLVCEGNQLIDRLARVPHLFLSVTCLNTSAMGQGELNADARAAFDASSRGILSTATLLYCWGPLPTRSWSTVLFVLPARKVLRKSVCGRRKLGQQMMTNISRAFRGIT